VLPPYWNGKTRKVNYIFYFAIVRAGLVPAHFLSASTSTYSLHALNMIE
jgi:hypothetical protein